MRIDSSLVSFQAAHASTLRHEHSERLDITVAAPAASVPPAAPAAEAPQDDGSSTADPVFRLIKSLIERMFGITVAALKAGDLRSHAKPADVPSPVSSPGRAGPPAGWGVTYSAHDRREDSETLAVSAQGVVRTADGREIRFALDVALSRTFVEEHSIDLRMGDAARKKTDPLVINFDGTAAQLAADRIAFDLDADGKAEAMPFVSAGSGLLVLDRNGDGVANDGRELFGPASGNGFAELSALDQDHNGWIDEADPAFQKLVVWRRNDGKDSYQTLAQAGVGAINVDHVASAFEYRDGANAPVASLQSTGVYLAESGQAGTVQQVDFYT